MFLIPSSEIEDVPPKSLTIHKQNHVISYVQDFQEENFD